MGFEEAYVPESEEEWELMEDIHIATRRANRCGLSRPEIARLLAFMASATLATEEELEPIERPTAAEESDEDTEPDPPRAEVCPGCAEPIEDVHTGMGGDLYIQPCGCTIRWEEREQLGAWIEEVGK